MSLLSKVGGGGTLEVRKATKAGACKVSLPTGPELQTGAPHLLPGQEGGRQGDTHRHLPRRTEAAPFPVHTHESAGGIKLLTEGVLLPVRNILWPPSKIITVLSLQKT